MLENKYQWLDALSRSGPPPQSNSDGAHEWPSGAYMRAVGLAISTWMQPQVGHGFCSAAIEKIAKRAGCSERQVRRCLDALEAYGCITRVQPEHQRTAIIRLCGDAFGWRDMFQPELELEDDLDGAVDGADPEPEIEDPQPHDLEDPPDCESGYPAHQSTHPAHQSTDPAHGAYKDHQEHHQEDHPLSACRPAAVSELVEAFGPIGPVDVGKLEHVVASASEAPWDYVLWLVGDIARRCEGARATEVVRMLLEDLAAEKWRRDKQWAKHLADEQRAEVEAEHQAKRAEEFARWELEERERAELRAEIMREADPGLVERWREHLLRVEEWLRQPTEESEQLLEDRICDELLRTNNAEPPAPPPVEEPKTMTAVIDHAPHLAAMRAAIFGGEDE